MRPCRIPMKNTNHKQISGNSGFTLIELMTVTAITGLLMSLALPAFQRYTDRARFSEAILVTNNLKTSIEIAASRGLISDIRDINSGINGIPDFEFGFSKEGSMHFVGVLSGTIFVMWPLDGSPLQGQSYILRAESANSPINWVQGGSCLSQGYC